MIVENHYVKMRIPYRYYPKSDFGIYFFVGIFLSVVVFLIVFIATNWNFKISILAGIVVFFIVFIYSFLSDFFGKKKHVRFVHSKLFIEISNKLNFRIESQNNDNYRGLKGTFKNYFFRIYYNWNSTLNNKNIFREICIMLHFLPPINQHGKLDTFLLDKLNKKYREPGFFKHANYCIRFEASYIQISLGYSIRTNYNDIISQIERAVKIATDEKLVSISEKEVYDLVAKDFRLNGPNIETFQNKF